MRRSMLLLLLLLCSALVLALALRLCLFVLRPRPVVVLTPKLAQPRNHMMLRTVNHLTRLPTLLRTPLCRRCTSGAPSEYLQEPSEKQLAYAEALAEQVHSVAGRGCPMRAPRQLHAPQP